MTGTDHTITEGSVTANDVTFAILECGTGPLALCLHGFPDSAWSWRHLLPRLAEAGYHAVAPFMRGYAPTAVPDNGLYQTAALASDAVALHTALGAGPDAVIIGHDWGAPAAYGAANSAPQLWSKVVGMAVPPGGVMSTALLNPVQLQRSWYMFFFQHGLSDMVVPMNDLAFLDHLWSQWSPGFDATDELVHVKNALRHPANLAAALGYYRASLGAGLRDPALDPIQASINAPLAQPTLYLHGADDGCIGVEWADNARPAMGHPQSQIQVVTGAGHFMQVERPNEVNRLIVEFLAR